MVRFFRVSILSGLCSVAVGLLYSCSSSVREVDYVALQADKSIEQFSDSTFFGNVSCLIGYGDDIYVSDKKRCQIFRLDTALNLLATIGSQGHGPQELGYVSYFSIDRDTLFVGDPTKLQILRFAPDGSFLESEDPDKTLPLNHRFGVKDNHIYYESTKYIEDGNTLVDYDRGASELKHKPFGRFENFGYPIKNIEQNRRDVHLYGDRIVVVPLSIPTVEIYDRNTLELIRSVDISEVPVVWDMYQKMTSNREILENPNVAYMLFLDSYLHDDRLYIAVSIYSDDRLDHSVLLEFDLSKGGAEWVRQYDFPEWTDRICVTDDYIYGFVPTYSSIKRYPKPKTTDR